MDGKRKEREENCDPSVDPEYAHPGKLLWIRQPVDFPICHGHVQDVAQPLLSEGSTLKTRAKSESPVFQAPSPAVGKSGCEDPISRIHLLLPVGMPWPATWEQTVTEKPQLSYSEGFCLQ